jgi:multicomponent Na+:H+ antiporter subunit C
VGEFFFERYNYFAVIILMMGGLYVVFSSGNMIKRLVGLGLFQTAVFIFYITLGKVSGGTASIIPGWDVYGHGKDYADAGHGAAYGTDGAAGGYPAATEAVATPDAGVAEPALDPLMRVVPEVDLNPYRVRPGDLQIGPGLADGPQVDGVLYTNPLPSVLILTAIVVGVATLSVGLALTVRTREAYGSIEAEDIRTADADSADPASQGGRA